MTAVNAITGDVLSESDFHDFARLQDVKIYVQKALVLDGKLSPNGSIKFTTKVQLATQLKKCFGMKATGSSGSGVKRRITKKTSNNVPTSASIYTCICTGCTNMRNILKKNHMVNDADDSDYSSDCSQ